jgi:3-demethoxyubiquinol 3-hydroxylase
MLAHAAQEEMDHLAWCETRLQELGSHTSYFNPIWYAGSFAIGLAAGLAGDKMELRICCGNRKAGGKSPQIVISKNYLQQIQRSRAIVESNAD